ncbi:uncharacterized protein BX663DRAFT_498831 [Cokeromyces recurvatus]|uniref:uncharacterized protein n=1 Tax=Cokeromyces recurvatus TaxID=90255 RepID=UPI00221EAEFD|nr:uncharacterized protein BX663DRAFT_498831 [Cokeromyces recurvatus]KAI7906116.1 hypothetical protein BX663DRAFT_498831 [Cokeromyces recurvatus]
MVTLKKINTRINQSKWTKLYILVACLQGITIIALQTTIAYYNTAQVNKGLESDAILTYDLNEDEQASITDAIERLKRIKWENIAFVGFQLWFVCMSFDATVYQNAAEVITLAIMNFACAILGALEVIDGKRWLSILTDIKLKYKIPIIVVPIQTAYYVEIALSICVGVYAIIFAYVSYAVVREFGWIIYKKIGADISIQRMYRILQFFVLALKIDIFIEFLVSVFYLIQFALKSGFNSWTTIVFIVITLLILPMLYFGRVAVASESLLQMTVFILFQLCVGFQLILIAVEATDSEDYWYIWICFVILGLIIAAATVVLALLCIINFNKGLKPYIQRGIEKKETLHQQNPKNSGEGWIIDED